VFERLEPVEIVGVTIIVDESSIFKLVGGDNGEITLASAAWFDGRVLLLADSVSVCPE
jgi:hypothetical protein